MMRRQRLVETGDSELGAPHLLIGGGHQSSQHAVMHLAVHIGQSALDAIVIKCQAPMIDAEQV